MINLFLSALLAGVLVGLISSVLGLGGGIILVPTLTIFFHLSQNEAIATSLATIAMVTLLNSIRFAQRKEIDWSLVLIILLFSAISSSVGGLLVTVLSEKILLAIFILFLLYVFVQMFLSRQKTGRTLKYRSRWYWASVIGLFSGLISGTTGVGGGVIITPLLYKSGIVHPRKAVPVTNAVMFLNAFFALIPLALRHVADHFSWGIGLIHLDRSILIFLGAIPASLLGTKYQAKIPVHVKKAAIGFILLIILIRMSLRLF